MERALAEAVHRCFPPGTVTTGEQPALEIRPPAAEDIDDKADIDILTKTGKRLTKILPMVAFNRASISRFMIKTWRCQGWPWVALSPSQSCLPTRKIRRL